MKSFLKTFVLYWLPAISLAAAIFIQSCFPSPQMVPKFPFADKLMHWIAYSLLAALCYRALRRASPFSNKPTNTLILIAVAMASLNGMSDEWHQSFVPARQADLLDLLADIVGACCGAIGYACIAERLRPTEEGYSLIDKLIRFL